MTEIAICIGLVPVVVLVLLVVIAITSGVWRLGAWLFEEPEGRRSNRAPSPSGTTPSQRRATLRLGEVRQSHRAGTLYAGTPSIPG